ncbi:sulfotransferase domain-containing protein [Ferrovibrio sp.]|uniref:sulfotransferase domain-containing protein n=1 Tax=Ferrovibrio sp. TaxID=1917215 RepID=UPI003D13742D
MSSYYWLASYPKSGNTWLRLSLSSLDRGGAPPDFTTTKLFAPISGDRAAIDEMVDIDTADLTAAEAQALLPDFFRLEAAWLKKPQLRKVHEAWTITDGRPLFPPNLTAGAIYIVRDPRDVAVSLAHHLSVCIDEAIAFMNDPHAMLARGELHGMSQIQQELLTWSEHVRSWMGAPIRLLLLRYEDMLADPVKALSDAANHLGWQASAEHIARAVAATRFDALRAAEERFGFREKAGPDVRFFRRGVAGGWRDTLSARQVATIEAAHHHVMAELGYL